jgi:uncharacterized protein
VAGRLLAALVAWCAIVAAAWAAPNFPELTSRVVDGAGLLSAADRLQLVDDLAALETKSTDQFVVVTVKSLQGYEIEEYGYQLGRHWGIGQAGGKNNGVLLIVAPNERKVRIEVGRGLEPTLTDALTKAIIENRILPAFRRGDFAGGIKLGARDIQDALLGDAEAVKERARGARRPAGQAGIDPVVLIFLAIWLLMAFLIIRQAMRQSSRMPADTRQRRRPRDNGWIIVPGPGHWGGSGNWGGGGGGGGGFSGGGGDFGGGGASGSW